MKEQAIKKVLFVATVFGFLDFERSDMEILKRMGYEIHIATNINNDDVATKLGNDDGRLDYLQVKKHQISFPRSPFSKKTYIAYRQLKTLMQEIHFDLIHCHTPVAAAITRFAAINTRKKGTKVIYTDHGFHFHKTSGWRTWVLYYPVEFFAAFYTDMILTVNREDWQVIQRFPIKEKRYIPGVGVAVRSIMQMNVDRTKVRQKFNIPQDAFVILSLGELSTRKNHEVIIRALSQLNIDNIYYVICGDGAKMEYLKQLALNGGISNRVILAGRHKYESVLELVHAVDLGALPSLIEGLGFSGIEILAAGKPLVASNVHGIKDYVVYGETGITCPPHDVEAFKQAIHKMYYDNQFYMNCCSHAQNKALLFDIDVVRKMMESNYHDIIQSME